MNDAVIQANIGGLLKTLGLNRPYGRTGFNILASFRKLKQSIEERNPCGPICDTGTYERIRKETLDQVQIDGHTESAVLILGAGEGKEILDTLSLLERSLSEKAPASSEENVVPLSTREKRTAAS